MSTTSSTLSAAAATRGRTDARRPRSPWGTFDPIELLSPPLPGAPFSDFVKALMDRTETVMEARAEYYGWQQRSRRWVNQLRNFLALSGAVAILATALAAALRVSDVAGTKWDFLPAGLDVGLLAFAVLLYAVMGAVSFYNTGADSVTSYFRHVAVRLAIRDLWTKFQFAVVRELGQPPADPAAEAALRSRLLDLSEAFCRDLDALSTKEQTDWQTEFVTSVSELEKTANKGLTDSQAGLEKALKEIRDAMAQQQAANQPGLVNLTLKGGFTGTAVVLVDEQERIRTTKSVVALPGLPPGLHLLRVRASDGQKDVEASRHIAVKPGLQDQELTLA